MEEEVKTALFDMDGTLFDYVGQLRRDMAKLAAPGEPDYEDLFDESKPHLKARMDLIKSVPGWWYNLPKLQAGWEVFEQAQAAGFHCHILTKGPWTKPLAWAEKLQCIQAHFQGVSIDIVGQDKSARYGRVLVEDYPPYIEGWLKWRPRGLVVLIDQPYNRGFEHLQVVRYTGDNLLRVRNCLHAAYKRDPKQNWQDLL